MTSDRCKFHIKIMLDLRFKRHMRGGFKQKCYLRPEQMSNNMLCDNSGIVPHCGRFSPDMATILTAGQGGDVEIQLVPILLISLICSKMSKCWLLPKFQTALVHQQR